ncbi:hypothetical protein L2E82_19928 [Cichorium intybus]|uniref:Uncharacterized protein n=1 Tax=Cichorium intybus TaxID=13427 RepID=A0ACB9DSX7_CICIN|nr:hypothetical protein L2E82_19928 [Cichorium intybus]
MTFIVGVAILDVAAAHLRCCCCRPHVVAHLHRVRTFGNQQVAGVASENGDDMKEHSVMLYAILRLESFTKCFC